jgi:hypothetical protein
MTEDLFWSIGFCSIMVSLSLLVAVGAFMELAWFIKEMKETKRQSVATGKGCSTDPRKGRSQIDDRNAPAVGMSDDKEMNI